MINNYFNYVVNIKAKEEMVEWILFLAVTRVGYTLSRDAAVQQKGLPPLERRFRAWFGTGKAVKYFRWAVRAVEFIVMGGFLFSCTHAAVLSVGWLAAVLLWIVLYAVFELICTAAQNIQA